MELAEPLRPVLDRYAQAGLNVVSSTRNLPDSLRVIQLPNPNAPLIEQIKSLLQPHQLTLIMVDDHNGYVARLHQDDSVAGTGTPTDSPATAGRIEEIIVTSHYRVRRQANLNHSVDQHDLLAAPSLGRDVMRNLEALPGIASSGVSARHQFRGGDVNEVLYRLDGVELLEPFHLPDIYDLFSAVNMNIVEAVDVYVSGYPVSLGSRMSGVVDLELAEPSKPVSGHVDMNLISAAADVSGWRNNWSWLASGRRSLVDKALQQLDTDYGTPRFHDEFLQVAHENSEHAISFNLLNSRDRVTVSNAPEEGQSNNDYLAAWLHWRQIYSPHLSANWSLQHVTIENRRRGSIDAPSFAVGSLLVDQHFSNTELANQWQWLPSPHWRVDAGWSFAYQQADFATDFDIAYGPLAFPIQQRTTLVRTTDVDRSGESTQAYLSVTTRLSETLELETGVRYDGQDIDPVHVNEVSGRVNLSWQATPKWLLALNAGRYTQQQHLYEIQIDDGKAELDDPQHSDQVNLTSIVSLTPGMRLRLDLYHRHIDNAWSHFENLYNRWVLFPELQGDRFEIVPSEVSAEGFELTFSHTPNRAWTWYVNYSRSRAREEYLGKLRERPWAQQDSLKAGLRWQNQTWRLGVNATYRSGWPTTRLITTPPQLAPNTFASELPRFFSLDTHLSRLFAVPRGELEVYLDVMNLTNRDNIGGYDYPSPNTRDAKTLLPLTPVLGVLWRW